MNSHYEDYMDADVAYLVGLVIARGTFSETTDLRKLIIPFNFTKDELEGISSKFNQRTQIRLGLDDIRNRLQELLDTEIDTVPKERGVDFVIKFIRNSMIWRNLLLITNGAMHFPHFKVPMIFFNKEIPLEWKREFIRGFADVAGNIREANRYVNHMNRVRLDVLNYPTNWDVPIQICKLLQEHLDVPVQNITWGHPNMNREFREHQINIFAVPFMKVGFSLKHKNQILKEFAEKDLENRPNARFKPCPGRRSIRNKKTRHPDEKNIEKLPDNLLGKHFNAYWEICNRMGCTMSLKIAKNRKKNQGKCIDE